MTATIGFTGSPRLTSASPLTTNVTNVIERHVGILIRVRDAASTPFQDQEGFTPSWSRDPAGISGSSLSNGLRLVVNP